MLYNEEMIKLINYLDKNAEFYYIRTKSSDKNQVTVIGGNGLYLWDATLMDNGLLKLSGSIVGDDIVISDLTAKDIIDRIESVEE